jgi:hypothetical protein
MADMRLWPLWGATEWKLHRHSTVYPQLLVSDACWLPIYRMVEKLSLNRCLIAEAYTSTAIGCYRNGWHYEPIIYSWLPLKFNTCRLYSSDINNFQLGYNGGHANLAARGLSLEWKWCHQSTCRPMVCSNFASLIQVYRCDWKVCFERSKKGYFDH